MLSEKNTIILRLGIQLFWKVNGLGFIDTVTVDVFYKCIQILPAFLKPSLCFLIWLFVDDLFLFIAGDPCCESLKSRPRSHTQALSSLAGHWKMSVLSSNPDRLLLILIVCFSFNFSFLCHKAGGITYEEEGI